MNDLRVRLAVLTILAAPAVSLAQVSLSPLTSFGGGDGWLAPGEGGYKFLGTGTLERGLAFGNDHLYLVSRQEGTNVRILDPQTGADLGGLNVTGVAGGTFAANMVGVGGDGAIYVGNLTTSAASPFKVYQWATEGSVATVAYTANPGLPRIGDSFAVTGTGANTAIVASGSGSSGFASINPSAGTGTAVTVSGTAAGAYRLGMTFENPKTVVGSQGGSWQVTEFSGATGTLLASVATPSANERLLAYDVVGGTPLLATANTLTSQVRIYDFSSPTDPKLVAVGNNTSGVLAANGTGVGSLAWENIDATTARLYVMSANQGIQAFTVSNVPEPETYMMFGVGLALTVVAHRRQRCG